jgi:hypothetical protein
MDFLARVIGDLLEHTAHQETKLASSLVCQIPDLLVKTGVFKHPETSIADIRDRVLKDWLNSVEAFIGNVFPFIHCFSQQVLNDRKWSSSRKLVTLHFLYQTANALQRKDL